VSGAAAVQNDFGWAAVWALVGAAIAGLFSWLTQRSKGQVDQSVAVLAEWSKLNTGLATRLTEVERECAAMRREHAVEIEAMRKSHAEEMEAMRKAHAAEIDEMRQKHRADMRAQRELNEGLQRMIAANSQSAAQLLSDSPVTRKKDADE